MKTVELTDYQVELIKDTLEWRIESLNKWEAEFPLDSDGAKREASGIAESLRRFLREALRELTK